MTLCFTVPHFTLPDIGSMFFQNISTHLPGCNMVSLSKRAQRVCSPPLNFKYYIICNFQNCDLHTEFWWINLRETDHLRELDVDGKIILNRILTKYGRGCGLNLSVI